ncbi:SurA N-terminal domain-containing protein [Candidatus Binatia bacterium]|nr:SurA N-terminal domain-containing protein [Candidatus Binatia bacterium]
MLKFMRRNAASTWVKAMFLVIVLVFIFWGFAGSFQDRPAQAVATVNGEPIQPVTYYRTYNNMVRAYRDAYKDKLNPELLKMLDLKRRALDQLVQANLLRQEAERLGLRTSEDELRKAIAAMPAFQNEWGVFDKDLYVRVLRANNFNPAEFEDAQREELLVRKLQDLVVAGVNVSEDEVREQFDFDNDQVDLRVVKFEPGDYLDGIALGDTDLQKYYDEHTEEFRDPERAKIEYVLYAPQAFAGKAAVSDADVQQYYEANRAKFTTQEQVRARHILFSLPPDATDEARAEARKKAEEVLGKARAGDDFAELAKQHSGDSTAPQGGDLGAIGRGQMVKPFEDAAFALQPGQISDVVETQFGLHIVKVDSRQDARTRPLDEVRAEIVATLTDEKARNLARSQAEADREKVVGGTALATVAEAAGLTVQTPPPFGIAEPIEGLGRASELANAAFATSPGSVGPLVSIPKGFVVFRETERLEPRVPPLNEIRPRVTHAAKGARAVATAREKAAAARTALQQSKNIDAVARDFGRAVADTGLFSRRGPLVASLGTAPELKKIAFTLTPENPVAPGEYAVGNATIVAMLKERKTADDAKFAAEKSSLIESAESQRKNQALQQFLDKLKAGAAVTVDETFMTRVADSGLPTNGL